LAKAIAIPLKMWYNDSPIKSEYNCTKYFRLVQDLKGKKRILSQVIKELSDISGIKVLSYKLHGGYCRKRLVSGEGVWENFFLIRIHLKYQRGQKGYKKSPVIYPSDVYPYGRQTLEVVEETAEKRYKEEKSWKELEDDLFASYNFSLNRIKRMINRVSLVFERLVTSQILPLPPFLQVSGWIRCRVKSFESLTICYRHRMVSGLFCRSEVIWDPRDLFSP
jgi:hypothetical protein